MSELRYPLFSEDQKQQFTLGTPKDTSLSNFNETIAEFGSHPDQKNLEEILKYEELFEILKYYKIDAEKIGLHEIEPDIFSLPITSPLQLPAILPPGYALKGGAARALLLRQLGVDITAEPRDLDIIRIIPEEPEPNLDEKMLDIFESEAVKYKLEVEPNLNEYFNTRDITQNEVLATQNTIFTTKACILDTVRHILRLTDYEYDSHPGHESIGPKMKIRLLRLYSDALHRYGQESEIPDMPKEMWAQETENVRTFFIALQFDKACEQGKATAETFIQTLKEAGIFPKNINSVEDAYEFLNKIIFSTDFYFRSAPIKAYEEERTILETYPDNPKKYESLNSKEQMRPRGVRKMKHT